MQIRVLKWVLVCAALTVGLGAFAQKVTTEAQCRAAGGAVIVDTGDGRVHNAAFRCPDGAKPIARIRFGLEGAACCPKANGVPDGGVTVVR